MSRAVTDAAFSCTSFILNKTCLGGKTGLESASLLFRYSERFMQFSPLLPAGEFAKMCVLLARFPSVLGVALLTSVLLFSPPN